MFQDRDEGIKEDEGGLAPLLACRGERSRFEIKVKRVPAWLDLDLELGFAVVLGWNDLLGLVLDSLARRAGDLPAGLLVPKDLDTVFSGVRAAAAVQVVVAIPYFAGRAHLRSLIGDEGDSPIIHRFAGVADRALHATAARVRRATAGQRQGGDRQKEESAVVLER